MKKFPVFIIVSAIFLALLPNSAAIAATDEYVYTKNYSGDVYKRPLDGTGSWTSIGNMGDGGTLLVVGNYIYLCYLDIKRMNLDGTGLTTVRTVSGTLGCTSDGTYIYYGYETTQSIGRMNLDGTGANDNWLTFTDAGLYSGWLAASNGSIYFGGGANVGGKVLAKVSTSGGAVTVLYTDPCSISGIAVDASNIYLSHYYCSTVAKLQLNGTLVTSTFMTGLPYGYTWAAHIWNGYLYILDTLYVARIKLDGTGSSPNYIYGSGTRGMAISGTLVTATTFSGSTYSASVAKGISSNISATFSAAGSVTFFANGKKISGCIKVPTNTSAPFTATCSNKPAVRGSQKITASFTPTSASNLPLTVDIGVRAVITRTTKR